MYYLRHSINYLNFKKNKICILYMSSNPPPNTPVKVPITYEYNQTLFINTQNIDYGDLDFKLRAMYYVSAAYTGALGGNLEADGTTTYTFGFDDTLSTDDKATLDAFVTNYYFIPMIDKVCIIRETKPTGVDAGTFLAGEWQIRTLNELTGMQSFATLANNQFTIAVGTYVISVKATSCNVQGNKVRIKNVTNNSFIYGPNCYSGSEEITTAGVDVYYNCLIPTTFQIEHMCATTVATTGLGKAISIGPDEIYSTVFVQYVISF